MHLATILIAKALYTHAALSLFVYASARGKKTVGVNGAMEGGEGLNK